MAADITDEMRNEIAAHPGEPVPIIDRQSNEVYNLVGENTPLLKALIQAGIASPKVSAEETFAQMRQRAAELSQGQA